MSAIDVLDRLSPAQLWLYENVATNSALHTQEQLKEADLNTQQQEHLFAAVEHLQQDESRIVLNADLRKNTYRFYVASY